MHAPAPPRTLDDAALARAVAAGAGREAEAEVYRRLFPRARLYGLAHLRDPHAAQDLAQQVLLMTLEALRAGRVQDPDKLASFVLGTCRMVVLEQRRGARRREALLAAYGEHDEAFQPPEPIGADKARLAGCLGGLAQRERSVLVLTFFAEKDADAVGRELGIAAGNVRVVRHRALARLRECMEAA